MATWYVLLNPAGDPASIASQPIAAPPAGYSVVEITSDGQPNIGEWWDPVQGGTQIVPKAWDRVARNWVTMITPEVKDRILDDLTNDPRLVAAWQRLTVDQRTALRTVLADLLRRRRYRYSNEPVDLGD